MALPSFLWRVFFACVSVFMLECRTFIFSTQLEGWVVKFEQTRQIRSVSFRQSFSFKTFIAIVKRNIEKKNKQTYIVEAPWVGPRVRAYFSYTQRLMVAASDSHLGITVLSASSHMSLIPCFSPLFSFTLALDSKARAIDNREKEQKIKIVITSVEHFGRWLRPHDERSHFLMPDS